MARESKWWWDPSLCLCPSCQVLSCWTPHWCPSHHQSRPLQSCGTPSFSLSFSFSFYSFYFDYFVLFGFWFCDIDSFSFVKKKEGTKPPFYKVLLGNHDKLASPQKAIAPHVVVTGSPQKLAYSGVSSFTSTKIVVAQFEIWTHSSTTLHEMGVLQRSWLPIFGSMSFYMFVGWVGLMINN